MSKRILGYEDHTVGCDIMLVVKENSNFTGRGKLTNVYNCLNFGGDHLQPKNDYECMLYAMLRNPECKGFLFLADDERPFQVEKLLKGDGRNRIWYKQGTNTKRFEVSFTNKTLFRSNKISFCRKAFKELALLIQIWINNLKKQMNTSSHKPWNVGMALNALLWNGNGTFVCFYEDVGSFYIPVKYRENFLGVASIFSKIKMPNDLSVPTILKSLDLESTFIHIIT